jgi:hypothetical protein
MLDSASRQTENGLFRDAGANEIGDDRKVRGAVTAL